MSSEKPLLPVYLFNGDDALKQETLLKRLVARIAAQGDIDFNHTSLSATKLETGAEVIDACLTLPFCSDYRLVVLKQIDKAKKAVIDDIASYLKDPASTTVLALTAEKLPKNLILYKTIEKIDPQAIIDCFGKRKHELPTLVRAMATKHGVTIAPDAALLLVHYVGVSTIALDSELSKLASHACSQGRGEIIERDIRDMVSRTAEVQPWELSDALGARDVQRCLELLSYMPLQSPYGLLALCLTRIRELLVAKSLEARPGSISIASVLGGPDWRYKNHQRWAHGFQENELIAALGAAAQTEYKMKTGADPNLAFEMWLMSVCRTTAKEKCLLE